MLESERYSLDPVRALQMSAHGSSGEKTAAEK